jgi:hypothetical protein
MALKNWMIILGIVLLTADLSIAVNKSMSPMETLQGSFNQIITMGIKSHSPDPLAS